MPTEISSTVVEVLVAGLDPYEQKDAVTAALDELAAYFQGVTGVAAARRGWPEHQQDLDLTAGPVITATLVDARNTPIPPAPLADNSAWRTDEIAVDVMLDLWCAYRAQRDEVARAVEDAFHNSLPWRHGLRLASRGYHGRPLVVTASSGRNTDEPEAATAGEWRRTWMLAIQTDLVREVALPTQDTIIVQPTVQDVVEPDVTIS